MSIYRQMNYRNQKNCSNMISNCCSNNDDACRGCSEGNRFQILTFTQVMRLHEVLEAEIPVHSRVPGTPTIHLKLKDLIREVRSCLSAEGIEVRDVRLNGGAASYVVGMETCSSYSDLDLLFGVDLTSSSSNIQRVKASVLDALVSFLPGNESTPSGTLSSIKETYIQKQFRMYSVDSDCWSLISLGSQASGAKTVELKFVDRMRRQFEFTVDSFQIILDSLLTFYEISTKPITEHFYPTVVAESVSGSFHDALYDLNNKLIATKKPEMIRGGGLLKYCKLLVDGYRPAERIDIRALERYMCSRFFIDFPDLMSQRNKLQAYLANHFAGQDDIKVSYLQTLCDVVSSSTVCLMSHERFQTLELINVLLNQVIYQMHLRQSSTIHLEAFCNQDWVLDQVFYGTAYFPVLSPGFSSVNSSCSSGSTPCQLSPMEVSPEHPFPCVPTE